ncbi:hypothetical protein CYMTET_34429, partial [Cymbomonas tetramitiformis]
EVGILADTFVGEEGRTTRSEQIDIYGYAVLDPASDVDPSHKCSPAVQGFSFNWTLFEIRIGARAVVTEHNIPLDPMVTMSNHSILHLPPHSVEVGRYRVQLEACARGVSEPLCGTTQRFFEVERQALRAIIRGGNSRVGENTTLLLDASDSEDPDNPEGPLRYSWRCNRADGDVCTTPSNFDSNFYREAIQFSLQPFPVVMMRLLGSLEGIWYNMSLTVSRGEGDEGQRSFASVYFIVHKGDIPYGVIDRVPSPISQYTPLRL